MDNKFYIRRAAYYETDRMGIVHHSNHIRYFEEARIDFMHKIGCDVLDLEGQGVLIPNVDAYARYLKPVRFYDDVYIEVKLVVFNGSRMEYDYTMRFCDNDEIASTGHTTHCFVNSDFKPISIKRAFPDFYQRLKDNMSE